MNDTEYVKKLLEAGTSEGAVVEMLRVRGMSEEKISVLIRDVYKKFPNITTKQTAPGTPQGDGLGYKLKTSFNILPEKDRVSLLFMAMLLVAEILIVLYELYFGTDDTSLIKVFIIPTLFVVYFLFSWLSKDFKSSPATTKAVKFLIAMVILAIAGIAWFYIVMFWAFSGIGCC